MADTFQLTDGTTTVDLIYNSSTNPNYKLRPGSGVGTQEPRAVWHRPSDYAAELIETVDDLQQAFLTIIVHQSSDIDDMLDAIVKARRLLRQAERYNSVGDVARVVLKIQLDGATTATVWPVMYGWVDDSRAQYESVSRKHGIAYDATLTLWLAPYGEAESSETVRNHLTSSPHMVEFNRGTGYADGITTAFTAPTSASKSSDAQPWLIGGSSQFFQVDNSNASGIYLGTVTASMGTAAIAYVWVYAGASADPLSISLTDGSVNTIHSREFDPASPANYDKTATDVNGNTWYRYSVFGTNSTAADFRLYVFRSLANASAISSYYVDGAYLRTQTAFIPDAYVSSREIDNRYDPVSGNLNRINYIDVWGVPGDAPALVNYELDWTSITGSKALVYGARVSDGRILAAQQTTWIDSSEFSATFGSNVTPSTGTGTSDNHYHRVTQDGSASTGSYQFTATISGDAARRLLSHPKRIFALVRTSDTATTFRPSVSLPTSSTAFFPSPKTINTVNQWELIDFGLLNLAASAPYDVPDTSEPEISVFFSVGALPASGSDTADFDALLFLPTDEFLLADLVNDFSTSNELNIRGQYQDVLLDTRGVGVPSFLGSFWTLEPGPVMNRITFAVTHRTTNLYTLTDAANVSLEIIPRTRHLLGTI